MADLRNIIRGDTHTINLTFPEDITGSTVFFTVNADREPPTDVDAVVIKEVTVHTVPEDGQTTIILDPADTDSIAPGQYWYDVQLKRADNTITSLPKGKFIIVSDITRRTSP